MRPRRHCAGNLRGALDNIALNQSARPALKAAIKAAERCAYIAENGGSELQLNENENRNFPAPGTLLDFTA